MAVIHVYSIDTSTDTEVRGSRLRAGVAQVALDHALQLYARYPPPGYTLRIFYAGDFVDPAFAELTQLAQTHGLDFEIDGG
jgi:hypothetical protein